MAAARQLWRGWAAGLDAPSKGEVRFLGESLAARSQAVARGRISMVFQDSAGSLDPRWRVRDIVAEPLRATGMRGGVALRRRVDALLTEVGLAPADGERYPRGFSGGQRQRIAIARALGSEPTFLVCDEPTSALDVSVQAQILNLISDLQQRLGLTMLLISHNLAVVRHMADTVAVMYLGRLVEHGPAEAIFVQPRHPYTQMLLDAVPRLSKTARAAPTVATEPAGQGLREIGCAFHPRCSFANARCREERPAYTVVGAVRVACHAVAEGRK